jgi:hypothetical protein
MQHFRSVTTLQEDFERLGLVNQTRMVTENLKHDLRLFMANNSEAVLCQRKPLEEMLENVISEGKYDHEAAKVAWRQTVLNCAAVYAKNGGGTISEAICAELAMELAEAFKEANKAKLAETTEVAEGLGVQRLKKMTPAARAKARKAYRSNKSNIKRRLKKKRKTATFKRHQSKLKRLKKTRSAGARKRFVVTGMELCGAIQESLSGFLASLNESTPTLEEMVDAFESINQFASNLDESLCCVEIDLIESAKEPKDDYKHVGDDLGDTDKEGSEVTDPEAKDHEHMGDKFDWSAFEKEGDDVEDDTAHRYAGLHADLETMKEDVDEVLSRLKKHVLSPADASSVLSDMTKFLNGAMKIFHNLSKDIKKNKYVGDEPDDETQKPSDVESLAGKHMGEKPYKDTGGHPGTKSKEVPVYESTEGIGDGMSQEEGEMVEYSHYAVHPQQGSKGFDDEAQAMEYAKSKPGVSVWSRTGKDWEMIHHPGGDRKAATKNQATGYAKRTPDAHDEQPTEDSEPDLNEAEHEYYAVHPQHGSKGFGDADSAMSHAKSNPGTAVWHRDPTKKDPGDKWQMIHHPGGDREAAQRNQATGYAKRTPDAHADEQTEDDIAEGKWDKAISMVQDYYRSGDEQLKAFAKKLISALASFDKEAATSLIKAVREEAGIDDEATLENFEKIFHSL